MELSFTKQPVHTILTGISKLIRRVRSEGVYNALEWLLHNLAWRLREKISGIDTSEQSHEVVVPDEGENHCYEAINPKCFEDAMRAIRFDQDREVFWDYGCGKGRAMILAARYPFRRILGIDRSSEICAIARQNLDAVKGGNAERFQVFDTCATTMELPDDVSVIFMFNPFSGSVMQAALAQIRASLKRRARRLQIIYVIARDEHDSLSECDWLREVRRVKPGYMVHDHCIIYQAGH